MLKSLIKIVFVAWACATVASTLSPTLHELFLHTTPGQTLTLVLDALSTN